MMYDNVLWLCYHLLSLTAAGASLSLCFGCGLLMVMVVAGCGSTKSRHWLVFHNATPKIPLLETEG